MGRIIEWMKEFRFASDAAETPQVRLSPQERQIFSTLLAVNKEFGLNTTFRAAGGWVRDKLLGKESDDIDIALDNMTGKQFEAHLMRYAAAHPEAQIKAGYPIDANPEKSKHLETVAMYINGQKIDFVNLRTEEYGDTSRIPTMKMGTPKVDAERRDLTINSLFYNANIGQVEDFVGGVKDLRDGLLKTPLDPKKTFMDDPLRMLRMLRFASRFGFKMDPSAVAMMADPEVQNAYRKISSNRAGEEIVKLMEGKFPAEALGVMLNSGLYKAVFDVPQVSQLGPLAMDQKNKHHAHNVMDHTLHVIKNMNDIMAAEGFPNDKRGLMNMAAFFHDFGKVAPGIAQPKAKDPSQMTYKGHEDKSAEIADAALKHIGVGDKDRHFVSKVVSLHMRPHVDEWSQKAMRRFLREEAVINGQDDVSKDLWKFVMLHGIADEMSKGIGDPSENVALKRRHMQQFEQVQNETPASLKKPLVNGNELMSMFPGIKPTKAVGPQKMTFIRDITNRMMEKQDAGLLTTKEDAIQFVESLRPQIQSTYGQAPMAGGPQA